MYAGRTPRNILVYGLEIGEERNGKPQRVGKKGAWLMNLHLECHHGRIILSLSSSSPSLSSTITTPSVAPPSLSLIHQFIYLFTSDCRRQTCESYTLFATDLKCHLCPSAKRSSADSYVCRYTGMFKGKVDFVYGFNNSIILIINQKVIIVIRLLCILDLKLFPLYNCANCI